MSPDCVERRRYSARQSLALSVNLLIEAAVGLMVIVLVPLPLARPSRSSVMPQE